MDQYICWSAHAQLRELSCCPEAVLGELGEINLSSRNPELECCWEGSQRATLISNIITLILPSAHTQTHRRPRLLQVCFGSILAAAFKEANEFFKALDFPRFFFALSFYQSESSTIALWVMRIWMTHLSGSSLLLQLINVLSYSERRLSDWLSLRQSLLLTCLIWMRRLFRLFLLFSCCFLHIFYSAIVNSILYT